MQQALQAIQNLQDFPWAAVIVFIGMGMLQWRVIGALDAALARSQTPDPPPLPPHAINYRANIRALADLGCEEVLSLNSVGSLKPGLPPGTLVSCSDYVGLQQGPATFFDTELKGGAPGIANHLIPLLVRELAPEFEIKTGKVYVQMRGPRFETKAEVRIVKNWGDVIGMTAAHEADLCVEAGLHYNSLALIDNYANGLEGTEIDFAKFKDLVKSNQEKVNRLFARILEILA